MRQTPVLFTASSCAGCESRLLLILALCLPLFNALSLPSLDHSLPGWNGEAPGVLGHEDWRGEILQLSWAPRAFLLKGFLSEAECDHLISKAKPSMSKSSVADNKTGKSFASEIRTSTGTFLGRRQDVIIAGIEQRVARFTMIPEENQEGMQILHYEDGQKYLPHHDYFHDTFNQDPKKGGQRLATVLMYLTTPEEGGETVFPNADRKVTGDEWSECAQKGMAVKSVRGDAVMFFSLLPDGTEDPTSLHGSCATTAGEKWSATKWIHVGSTTGITKDSQLAGWHGKKAPDAPQAPGGCADKEAECSEWAIAGWEEASIERRVYVESPLVVKRNIAMSAARKSVYISTKLIKRWI